MRSSGLKGPWAAGCAVAGLAVALAGCGRDGVQVYRVAKESSSAADQAPAAAGLPAGHPDTGNAMPTLEWKLPAGWQEAPPGEMRVASFRVPGKDAKQADVSVIPLPGMAGGDLGNVNRWRGQVGLAAVTEAELAKLAQPVQIDGLTAQLYDQGGQAPGSGDKSRILAALLRRNDVAWFFKMTGDDELVAQQKSAFVGFLESVKFVAGTAAPAVAAGELPPSHPPSGGPTTPTVGAPGVAPAASGDKPRWQVPVGWAEVPGGQFLVAKFTIAGPGNDQAAVNVSASAGDGGGLAGNLNRWRGQLGLGPLAGTEIPKAVTEVEVDGGKAMVVDLAGTDARTQRKARLVGAMVTRGGQTWFFKLMGNEATVERERPAFTTFLKSVKYPGDAGQ